MDGDDDDGDDDDDDVVGNVVAYVQHCVLVHVY